MEDKVLHVSFFGITPEEWDNIVLGSEETGSSGPLSESSFVVDATLKKGQYRLKTSGNNGYSARAWRIFKKGDAEVRTEDLPDSYYRPTGKVFAIGAGTDTSKIDTGKDEGDTEPSASPSVEPSTEPTPPVIEPTPPVDPPSPPPIVDPTEPPPTFDPNPPVPPVSDPGGGDAGDSQ